MVTHEHNLGLSKDLRYEHTHQHTQQFLFSLVMDEKEIKSVSKQGYSRPTMQNIVLNQLESDVFI